MHASQDAIQSPAAPDTLLQIVGPAKCGKTETIVKRIEHLIDNGVNPEQVLVLTLTGGSAEQLGKLLDGVCIETFGSFCYSIVNSVDPGWRTLEKLECQLVRPVLGSKKVRSDKILEKCIDLSPQELSKECDISLDAATRFSEFVASAKILSHKGLIDKAINLVERLSFDYKVVVVDNFEETSPQLCKLISLIAKGRHLTVAYDREQAIYGFLDAQRDQFNEESVQGWFPGMDSKSLVLKSHQSEVVSTAENVLKGAVNPLTFPSREKEIEWIVERINSREKDMNYGDIAILCFTNLQADQMRKYLEDVGIPCQKISSAPAWTKSLLFQVVNYLRCVDKKDRLAELCSISFIKGIKAETLHKLAMGEPLKNKKISDYLAHIKSLQESSHEWENDPQRILQVALDTGTKFGLKDHVYKRITTSNEQTQLYQDYIDDIYTTLCMLRPTGETLLKSFLQNYNRTFNHLDKSCVNVSTVHAAKYFHFKGVFLTGTQPFGPENRQVLYTGITRASRFAHWTQVNGFAQSYRLFHKMRCLRV